MPRAKPQNNAAKNFTALLKEHAITNTDLARTLGVHFSTITGWKGRGVPVEKAAEVADLFGVNIKDIVTPTGRRRKKTKTTAPNSPKPQNTTLPNKIKIGDEDYIKVSALRKLITS